MPKACQREWFDATAPYLCNILLMHDYDEIKVNTQAKIKGPRPSAAVPNGALVTEGAREYLLEIMADGRIQVWCECMQWMCVPLNVTFV